jgi:hypothetical protein
MRDFQHSGPISGISLHKPWFDLGLVLVVMSMAPCIIIVETFFFYRIRGALRRHRHT